jgi:hypothetical protein
MVQKADTLMPVVRNQVNFVSGLLEEVVMELDINYNVRVRKKAYSFQGLLEISSLRGGNKANSIKINDEVYTDPLGLSDHNVRGEEAGKLPVDVAGENVADNHG